ncbi:MAG: 50S ribosomal protein L11 methyltransferase, partial [Actinobacteria bacterium]|nr:50S ribosomal protein L11 methyltransferase [Actinomycetota bacterium]
STYGSPAMPHSSETQRYTLPRPPDGTDVVTARLWAAGALGLWERTDELVAWFPGRDVAVPPGGRWEVEEDRDWQAEWKAGIAPVTAGPFLVVPTWRTDEVGGAPGQIRIVLDPGRAFGSGHHATTTQCLELLAELDVRGARVLDVGTGTGILAIGAALLGAGEVVAVDVDPEAVEVARENAARNEVDVEVAVGSAERDDRFDVVLANLVTDTIVALAGPLLARTRPGGVLIASGIADERAGRAVAALTAQGLDDPHLVSRDGWTALRGTRPAEGRA